MKIQFRRDTAANLASRNPVLLAGEPCYATDTGVYKVGDGSTAYASLTSVGAASGSPGALGNVAQSYDPILGNSQFNLANGLLGLQLVYLPGLAVSTMSAILDGAGVTPGVGVNRMALYKYVSATSATLVDQTGDLTAALQGAPIVELTGALTNGVQTPAPGPYYLAIVTSFTGTSPKIRGYNSGFNIPAINTRPPALFISGQATLPASFNPSTASLNNGVYYLGIR